MNTDNSFSWNQQTSIGYHEGVGLNIDCLTQQTFPTNTARLFLNKALLNTIQLGIVSTESLFTSARIRAKNYNGFVVSLYSPFITEYNRLTGSVNQIEKNKQTNIRLYAHNNEQWES